MLGGERCGACVGKDDGPGGVCEKSAACIADAECAAYVACLLAECNAFDPDPACRLTCGGLHPEGARQSYQEVGGRYFAACSSECGGGQQWDCAQPAAWPGFNSGSAAVTLHVPAGTSAHACLVQDISCASPIAPSVIDAGDAIVFELDKSGTPDGGYYFHLVPPPPLRPRVFLPWQSLVGDIAFWPAIYYANQVAGLEAAVNARGETLDADGGTVIVVIVDCVGGLADYRSLDPTITVTADGGGNPVYSTTGQLDPALTGGGIAAFYNLSSQTLSLAVVRATETIARAVVPVRAGASTTVWFNYPQFF